MVYKAERLYGALGDSKKIFSLVAKLIFDGQLLEEIMSNLHTQTSKFDSEIEKFVKKRS